MYAQNLVETTKFFFSKLSKKKNKTNIQFLGFKKIFLVFLGHSNYWCFDAFFFHIIIIGFYHLYRLLPSHSFHSLSFYSSSFIFVDLPVYEKLSISNRYKQFKFYLSRIMLFNQNLFFLLFRNRFFILQWCVKSALLLETAKNCFLLCFSICSVLFFIVFISQFYFPHGIWKTFFFPYFFFIVFVLYFLKLRWIFVRPSFDELYIALTI